MKVVLSTLNAKYIHSSLALKYLKTACNKSNIVGSDIVLKEYTINNDLLVILSDIYSEKPDIVGLSCYIWNIDMTLKLAGLLKKVLPEVVIVLGGPEVSYDPFDVMKTNSFIDYVVQGEGEDTLKALLTALASNTPIHNIEGLSFRQKEEIVVGTPQIIANVNTILFPYCESDMEKLKDKIIYYESARGCPFSCQYCLSSATSGVRFFSLERVYKELEFFIRHDVRQVKFVDRTFNASKEHYLPILRFLAKQDCRTNFHFEIAVDILDNEVLDFLEEVPVGRFQFEIGIQSTYEPTLNKISRHNNWPKIVEHVTRIVSNQNIHVHLDLIVGLPYESYSQFGQSFNDVYQLQPHMLQIGFLKMLKGAGLRNIAEQCGYVFLDEAPYEVLSNNYLTYGDVRKLKILEEVFNQVYNTGRFKYTLEFLIRLRGGNAFEFYHDLSTYWEEKYLHLVSHSSKSIYKYLYDFCCIYHEKEISTCQEFLKFDALMSEKGAVQPEFLSWNQEEWIEEKNEFWRDQDVVRNYIPNYTFTTWRDLKKKYRVEVFSVDIIKYIGQPDKIVNQATPILFSYGQDTTIYQPIAGCDFKKSEGREKYAL
ncbi:MAG: hypothetical protein K0R78_2968 [Pelosinus sp.]|nr:hypothetical protein [Pelosinus sp.]